MELQTVHSSWVDAYAYDGGTLFVAFKDSQGRRTVVCRYDDVPLDLWIEFLGAPSKGVFVHQHLFTWPYEEVA